MNNNMAVILERFDNNIHGAFQIIRKHNTYKVQKEIKIGMFRFWVTIKKFVGYDDDSIQFAKLQAFELFDFLMDEEDNIIWHISE